MGERDRLEDILDKIERLKTGQEVALEAIAYTLRRFQVDPEFAYHMWQTETLAKLIRAFAMITGEDVASVRRVVEANAATLPKSRCCVDREFIDGGPHV